MQVSGSVRVRQERLDGQYRPGFDAVDDVLAMRSWIQAQWKKDGWRLVGEISDSRVYDTDTGSALTANDVNALELVQAYVARDMPDLVGKGSTATVLAGRFSMNLGSRRLVASDDYRNTPNGYTGMRSDLRLVDKSLFTLFYVLPQQRRPDDFASLRKNKVEVDHAGFDQQLWGAMASKPGVLPGRAMGELTYVGLQERDNAPRATRNRRLQSLSARAISDPTVGRTDYELEVIYQTGHIRASLAPAAVDLPVDAWFIHADIGHSFDAAWKPHLSIEYDYASGDGPGRNYQRFDTLFGMRRADLAPSGIYGAIGRANIETVGLRFESTPTERLDAFAVYRLLWAANSHDSFSTTGIRDASGASGRYAGQQIEARLRYWFIPRTLRAEVDGVWLITRGLLNDAPNVAYNGNPTYLSAALTYSF